MPGSQDVYAEATRLIVGLYLNNVISSRPHASWRGCEESGISAKPAGVENL